MSTINYKGQEIKALTADELFEYLKTRDPLKTKFVFWDTDNHYGTGTLYEIDFANHPKLYMCEFGKHYAYIGIIPEEPQLPDALPDLKIYKGEPASTYGITEYGGFMTWNDVIEKWEGKTFGRMEIGDIFYVDLSRPSDRILAEAQKVRDDFINSRNK